MNDSRAAPRERDPSATCAAAAAVQSADLLVVGSPTFKATHAALLKLFPDQIPSDGLAPASRRGTQVAASKPVPDEVVQLIRRRLAVDAGRSPTGQRGVHGPVPRGDQAAFLRPCDRPSCSSSSPTPFCSSGAARC